jgi:NADH:ubiquinone oxidoreductase subunit 4 (subunit M)
LFLALAMKVPILPFHLWLPAAHVEAPTTASVILAALMLKLGSYGFMRFVLTMLPLASHISSPFVLSQAIVSVIYCTMTAIRQPDLKKIIAYSSIGHMNSQMIGLFSLALSATVGSAIMNLSHGLISAALFFVSGLLFGRYYSRNVLYLRGLSGPMPSVAVFLSISTFANVGVPGTLSFVCEILIIVGAFGASS